MIGMRRRFHQKSRFGCTECRKRKVKCDESEPICGRCLRNRSKCTYPRMQSDAGSPSSASDVPGQLSFDLLDMTLMHHYAIDTCKHLFMGDRHIQVWQHDIPALAASNAILLHGILAITAVHYAWKEKEPVRRGVYRDRALYHHALGLPKFQEMVASASPRTAEVVVAYAILLGLFAYAFPEIAAEQQSLDDILIMVESIRAARAVFRLYRDTIMESPMGVFLHPPVLLPIPGDQVFPVRPALRLLRDEVQHESDKSAVQQLQALLDRYGTGLNHNRLAATWMASVEDGYWARLRSHQPHAILVFAYSTLLVRASEHECWWLSGWHERILQACNDVMRSQAMQGVTTVDWTDHEPRIRVGADELAKMVRSK